MIFFDRQISNSYDYFKYFDVGVNFWVSSNCGQFSKGVVQLFMLLMNGYEDML